MLGQEMAETGQSRRKPDKTKPSGTRGAVRTRGSSSPIPLLEHCDFNLGLLSSFSQLTADPVHLLKGLSASFPWGERKQPQLRHRAPEEPSGDTPVMSALLGRREGLKGDKHIPQGIVLQNLLEATMENQASCKDFHQ